MSMITLYIAKDTQASTDIVIITCTWHNRISVHNMMFDVSIIHYGVLLAVCHIFP